MADLVTLNEARALLAGKHLRVRGYIDDDGTDVDCSHEEDCGPVTPGQWLLETDREDTGDHQPEGAEYPILINVGDICLATEFESATVADARLMAEAKRLAETVVALHERVAELKTRPTLDEAATLAQNFAPTDAKDIEARLLLLRSAEPEEDDDE